MKIFTHIPYNSRDKNTPGDTSFHAQFQFDLPSYNQNILSYENSLF